MAAMMPAASGGGSSSNPYGTYDNDAIERDIIDPDDGMYALPAIKLEVISSALISIRILTAA